MDSQLEKYQDFWHWESLSSSAVLPWTLELIMQFKDYWDWEKLLKNDAIACSTELIQLLNHNDD